jgi:hypothetical protein
METMKCMVPGAVLFVFAGLLLANLRAADEKPKFTVKEVMKLHKEKLNEKFIKGEATKEEKEKLLEGYEALVKNKPPKGEEKDWKEKTEALVKAVKADDKKAYEKAVNCGACHKEHKP